MIIGTVQWSSPQDTWSLRVDIPGLLSVNADIYELGKGGISEAAIFSTVMPGASGNCGIVVWLSNLKGGGSLKWKKIIPPLPEDSEFLLLAPPLCILKCGIVL